MFTHWFMRTAHRNYIKSQRLADLLLGYKNPFWARDQDSNVSEEIVQGLSELTGKSTNKIHSLTLRAYEGGFFLKHNPFGKTRWILPLGVQHRTRKGFGLQFCHQCLATDPVPYFRRKWRIAFMTVCPIHAVSLQDCCGHCQAPVIFHRIEQGTKEKIDQESSRYCHACGGDLAESRPEKKMEFSNAELKYFLSFGAAIDNGYFTINGRVFHYAHLYFDVIHRLCNLLFSSKGERLLNIACEAFDSLDLDEARGRTKKAMEFELRRIVERHNILRVVYWLLDEWPDRYIQCCEESRICRYYMLNDCGDTFWFSSVVYGRLKGYMYFPNLVEAESAYRYMIKHGISLTKVNLRDLIGRGASNEYFSTLGDSFSQFSDEK